MLNWVPNKHVSSKTIESLLEKSYVKNQFSNHGPLVQELEKTARELLSINNEYSVVATSSGTSALHAIVLTLQIVNERRLTFGVSPFSFPCVVQGPLENSQIVDIDHNNAIDISCVGQVDGIVVTNLFGTVSDIEKYTHWASVNNKLLVFDSATAPLSTYKGVSVLNYGDGSCVSLHHTKPIGFGEGGLAVVKKEYEEILRQVINFGFHYSNREYVHRSLGSNYKMSDVSAAYILAHWDQLEITSSNQLKEYASKRMNLLKSFGDSDFLSCLPIVNKFPELLGELLLKNNIISRRYYRPLVHMPNSDKLFENVLCVPLHKDMTEFDIDTIVNIIRYAESE